MVKPRHRFQYKFWLDVNNRAERKLKEAVDKLKQDRQFAKHVRDGLRLMIDLHSGNVDVLIELFPWIADRFVTGQGMSVTPPTPSGFDEDKMTTDIAEKVALMINTGSIQASSVNEDRPTKKLGQGEQKQLSAPVFEDDDLPVIQTKADTSNSASLNFLRGTQGLQ